MSYHSFHRGLAKIVGVHGSIFLTNFKMWTEKNLANGKNIHDGLCWSYNTVNALSILFEYLTPKQIRLAIDKCIEAGLLSKGNYNVNHYDQTSWYALTLEAYEYFPELDKTLLKNGKSNLPKGQIDLPKRANRISHKGKPIPCTLPSTNTSTLLEADRSLKAPHLESLDAIQEASVTAVSRLFHSEDASMKNTLLTKIDAEIREAVQSYGRQGKTIQNYEAFAMAHAQKIKKERELGESFHDVTPSLPVMKRKDYRAVEHDDTAPRPEYFKRSAEIVKNHEVGAQYLNMIRGLIPLEIRT